MKDAPVGVEVLVHVTKAALPPSAPIPVHLWPIVRREPPVLLRITGSTCHHCSGDLISVHAASPTFRTHESAMQQSFIATGELPCMHIASRVHFHGRQEAKMPFLVYD